jgi:hypothetical protein
MADVVPSEWGEKPTNPGAYWVQDLNQNVFRVCDIIRHEGNLYVRLPGHEGGMPLSTVPDGTLRFFGPLSLPNGFAYIYDNAIYKDIEEPAEPC